MLRPIITLMLFLSVQTGFGQTKLAVYVWEFSTQHTDEDQKKLANLLTNDFETEVIKSGLYQFIEIRERSRLEEQRELQRLVFNIGEMSDEERASLNEKRAEAVFFGKLIYNRQSKENTLEVKLQHMDGRLLRKGSLYLDPSDLIMNENRRAKIHQLFENVHEDIFEEQRKVLQRQKKDNYELISQKLNLYLWRTEDLITQFRRLDLSLLSQEYLEEYNQTIYHYNALINDFLENHCKYESDFRNIWGADLGEKLQHSFEKILDFHERYMFKSLNRRNEQIPRFAQPQNKKEKQDLKNDLEKGKREFEETMADQWPIVKSGIEQFLRDLP